MKQTWGAKRRQSAQTVVDVHRGTLKKMETLKRGVSDRHDGYAGQTVEKTTVRRMCPLVTISELSS